MDLVFYRLKRLVIPMLLSLACQILKLTMRGSWLSLHLVRRTRPMSTILGRFTSILLAHTFIASLPDCRIKMRVVTRKLERALGPETGDLDMRFGLHSGAVTAGVLVGERARFQLFGDTGTRTAAFFEPFLTNQYPSFTFTLSFFSQYCV
jgi:hypothetical protein